MKVAFFQPRHFNRTERKTNPFFDPIIDVCREAGIPYRIYQPYRRPDTGYPAVCSSQYLRKFVHTVKRVLRPLLKKRTEAELERIAGKMWNVLTFGTWRADVYVTIAYELYAVLPGINPRARIVDVQHGILCPGHWGYLDPDGTVSKFLRGLPEREVWLSGDGYKELLARKAPSAEWVTRHVHVIGSPSFVGHLAPSLEKSSAQADHVLITMQLSDELSTSQNRKYLDEIERFLVEYVRMGYDLNKVIVRHHPRYNNCFDLTFFTERFPGIAFSSEPFAVLIRRTRINVTVDSTTVFDAAIWGVPTYVTGGGIQTPPVDWKNDFAYPYFGYSFKQLLDCLDVNGAEVHSSLKQWARYFYSPFDACQVRELLEGRMSS